MNREKEALRLKDLDLLCAIWPNLYNVRIVSSTYPMPPTVAGVTIAYRIYNERITHLLTMSTFKELNDILLSMSVTEYGVIKQAAEKHDGLLPAILDAVEYFILTLGWQPEEWFSQYNTVLASDVLIAVNLALGARDY